MPSPGTAAEQWATCPRSQTAEQARPTRRHPVRWAGAKRAPSYQRPTGRGIAPLLARRARIAGPERPCGPGRFCCAAPGPPAGGTGPHSARPRRRAGRAATRHDDPAPCHRPHASSSSNPRRMVSQELVHLFLGLLHAGECQLIGRGISCWYACRPPNAQSRNLPATPSPGYAEPRLLPAENAQAVVLVEVLVVLEVQGGERDAMGEAAGRDPHVVDRPRSPAPDGCRGQPPPGRSGPRRRIRPSRGDARRR
jgi:hypothetical protein